MQITLDNIKINYEVSGSGKNVLMLHGWGASLQSFSPVIAELSKTMRVTAIDFPGFGGSDNPPENFGVPEYMELTKKFIEQKGLSGTDIISHSFGGRVAIILASKYPELIGKIVFVDSAGLIKKRTLKYYIKIYSYKAMKKANKTKFGTSFFKLFGVDVKSRVKNAGSSDYKTLSDDMKKIFIRVVNKDLKSYLKGIKAPSLLIWGENDTDTPVYFGETMEKEIKDSGLVVLKGAGHYSYLDQYAQFMKIILNFLGGK